MHRTHHCNEIRKKHVGEVVTLSGWINSTRDHGGVIFIDLRDREGLTQVVFRPEENEEAAKLSHSLRYEEVLRIQGRVADRLPGTANENLATGEVEVVVQSVEVISRSQVLPFQLDTEPPSDDLRLRHRFLDLRRPRLARNLRLRHRVAKAVRDFLDERGYLEIETPILSKSTPEGARDFLVPSRLNPGKFYALPQAPQQYKQLLQVAGVDKYFQIARCFRDEDLRADRQPEFTQVDIEASFVQRDDILSLVEGLLGRCFKEALGVKIPSSFERMTYRQAMDRFGSDKPERRFAMELIDLTEDLRQCEFRVFSGAVAQGGVVKAINAKGFADISVGQMDKLTQIAQEAGAKGLAYIQVRDRDRSTWRSPFVKRMTDAEIEALRHKLNIEPGDLILFAADQWEGACEVLGRIRLALAKLRHLLAGLTGFDFLWVTDFPLLARDEEEDRWIAVHHPFTRPKAEDLHHFQAGDYAKVRAEAYDIVLNGNEIGGGSIRIHEPDLQREMFAVLGIDSERQAAMFGHLLRAFSFGPPPHGGVALGLDRLVMLICGEESIREVIAFPKNNRGIDVMSDSPAPAEFTQLRDLHLRSLAEETKPGSGDPTPP